MTEDTWQKAKEIFLAALEKPKDQRGLFVSEISGGDPALLEEVKSLLVSHEEMEGFIETPAFSVNAIFESDTMLHGKILGNYKIISQIGLGGMGAVFLAERADGEFHQKVAVKIVRPGFDSADVRRRFLHERQILADLEHPDIARLIDGGTTADGLPFIVMEYVEGVAVTEYCKSNRLSIDERLRLFQKVCQAVSFAHRNLVIHRDLKPSNIFITADGTPKLLDFGIAKLLDAPASSKQTLTNFRAFTPDYASPEQIRGEAITTASDVYSLGVLLYELLTERSPYVFKTRNQEEILRVIGEDEPTKPSLAYETSNGSPTETTRTKALPRDLENIVLLALRKEPERRYGSVEQFSDDIQRYLNGLPVLARKDTFAYRSSKFVRRHKVGVIAAALVIFSLLGGLGLALREANAARLQRDAAEAEKIKAERINKFLQEMLSYSNQSWTSSSETGASRDATINEMLDDLAPRVESSLADQPQVRAQILRTIGNAYESQARYDQAEKYMRLAAETARQVYGDESVETAFVLTELGEAMYYLSKFDEAGDLFSKSVEIFRRQPPSDPSHLAFALHGLGVIKFAKGDHEGAFALLQEALDTASRKNPTGKERGLIAEIKLNLGTAYLVKGDLETSERLYRESIGEFRALPGNQRWETALALSKLGECLIQKQKYAEAEAYLLEGEGIYRKTLGDSNNYLVRNLTQQSLLAYEKKNYAAAETKGKEALEILRQTSPEPDQLYARAWLTLGKTLCRTRRTKDGTAFLRQSLKIYESANGKEITDVRSELEECSR